MHHADDGAVLGRDAVEIVHRANAAGARHVLHDDVRLAGNVRAQIRRERVGIARIAAAGAGAHDERHLPAFVELSAVAADASEGISASAAPASRCQSLDQKTPHGVSPAISRGCRSGCRRNRRAGAGRAGRSARTVWSSASPSAPVSTGAGARRGLSSAMRCDVGLARVDALDLEADVVHAAGDDAGAVIVGDVPRHDHQRHVPVGQVVVRSSARFLTFVGASSNTSR